MPPAARGAGAGRRRAGRDRLPAAGTALGPPPGRPGHPAATAAYGLLAWPPVGIASRWPRRPGRCGAASPPGTWCRGRRGWSAATRPAGRGEGSDVAGVRPFVLGDRLRRVNWRVTGRTGTLHVTSTYADRDTEVLLVLDSRQDLGRSPDSSLDAGVRAAAAVAEHYLRAGDRVGLVDLGQRYRVVPARAGRGAPGPAAGRAAGRPGRGRAPPGHRRRPASWSGGSARTRWWCCSARWPGTAALRTVAALARAGRSVVVVDTLPPGLRPDLRGEYTELAFRLWRLRRDADVHRLAELGVPVVPLAGRAAAWTWCCGTSAGPRGRRGWSGEVAGAVAHALRRPVAPVRQELAELRRWSAVALVLRLVLLGTGAAALARRAGTAGSAWPAVVALVGRARPAGRGGAAVRLRPGDRARRGRAVPGPPGTAATCRRCRLTLLLAALLAVHHQAAALAAALPVTARVDRRLLARSATHLRAGAGAVRAGRGAGAGCRPARRLGAAGAGRAGRRGGRRRDAGRRRPPAGRGLTAGRRPDLGSALGTLGRMADRPHILIVGGGYVGMYTALRLQRKLRRGEADITVVDPRNYMQYQPFLPETAAGSLEPRHVVVPLRKVLRRCRVLTGTVTGIDHARRVATVAPVEGAEISRCRTTSWSSRPARWSARCRSPGWPSRASASRPWPRPSSCATTCCPGWTTRPR